MTINRGFNHAMGVEGFNLLSDRNVKLKAKSLYENTGSDVIRCTLNKIPESASILQKSRLPLGLLLHPFKDKVSVCVWPISGFQSRFAVEFILIEFSLSKNHVNLGNAGYTE